MAEQHTGMLCNFPAGVNYPRGIKLTVPEVIKTLKAAKTLLGPNA